MRSFPVRTSLAEIILCAIPPTFLAPGIFPWWSKFFCGLFGYSFLLLPLCDYSLFLSSFLVVFFGLSFDMAIIYSRCAKIVPSYTCFFLISCLLSPSFPLNSVLIWRINYRFTLSMIHWASSSPKLNLWGNIFETSRLCKVMAMIPSS